MDFVAYLLNEGDLLTKRRQNVQGYLSCYQFVAYIHVLLYIGNDKRKINVLEVKAKLFNLTSRCFSIHSQILLYQSLVIKNMFGPCTVL